ncbi:MAG: M50 family metallopeptidase [Phycisphaerales bacterium]|nr:M50 family metallopeptidase [Hyphomonadaceae bacterium]
MRNSVHGFSAGMVLGFPLYIEMSALYLGPWIVLTALTQSSGHDLVRTLVFFALVPASVLVHELGHAFTARALGVPVRHIALTWFGGYASFWVQSDRWREAAIAFAGPLANLSLGAVLLALSAGIPDPNSVDLADGLLIVRSGDLAWWEHAIRDGAFINVSLGLFNMLPGLPLDGGHILRAALSSRMSYGRAAWIAAWSGLVIGVVAVAYAFWVESLWALIIGGFIIYSAWQERRRLRFD